MNIIIEDFTKQLVKIICKFEELDANFDVCCNFAHSNFKYHKYLDVNENNIQRSIEGLSTKFYVHGQDLKSEQIKQLCYKFLECDYFPVIIRYSILSLLFQLANSPLTKIYEPILIKQKSEEIKFDWKSYMNENLIEYVMTEDQDTDSNDTDSDLINFKDNNKGKPEIDANILKVENNDVIFSSTDVVMSKNIISFKDNKELLVNNIMSQYWSPMQDNHFCNDILLSSSIEFFCGVFHVVSEYQIIREVLWILSGASASFVFMFDGDKISVNPNISLKDVHPATLKGYLEDICNYYSIISNLKKFTNIEMFKIKCGIISQTLQAFNRIIIDKLNNFNQNVIALEKVVFMQNSINTLPSVLYELESHFDILKVMNYICNQCQIFKISNEQSLHNSSFSSYLLSCIFNELVEADWAKLNTKECLLSIWLQTFRPYLEIIDKFFYNGKLEDYHSEFFILEYSNNSSCDEEFWKSTYSENIYFKSMEISFLNTHCINELIVAYKSLKLMSQLRNYNSIRKDNINTHLVYIYKERLMKIDQNNFKQIYTESNEILNTNINARCSFISTNLVQLIKNDYNLLFYMKTIQDLYLMGSGNTMFLFSSAIYEKIKYQQPWRNESILNTLLHNALEDMQHLDMNSLEICLSETDNLSSALNIFNTIQLCFKVEWPINILLNDKSFTIYNKIFQYLLKIKWIKYLIEGLKLKDLVITNSSKGKELKNPQNNVKHRIYILRYKLLNFVNCLHTYIMTRILHHIGIQFLNELMNCKNFDSMINLHDNYVTQLFERCLLQPNVVGPQQVISSILELVISLVEIWNNFKNSQIRLEIIIDMEDKFTKCVQFLYSTLSNFTQHGAFLHFEALAYSLATCLITTRTYQNTNLPNIF